MGDLSWKTGLTRIAPNVIRPRGYDVNEVMRKLTFPGAVHLLWTGEIPTKPVERLLSAIMIGSMDHGASPPSVNVARIIASTGGAHSAAIGAGITALNKYHGAAVEDCMRMLHEFRELKAESGDDDATVAREILGRLKARGERAWGMGHRVHTADPRLETLFSLCEECDVGGEFMSAARAMAAAVSEKVGKQMPVNIDGATAACLCEIGFPIGMANALFCISRAAGIAIQSREEMEREKPMRKIHPADFEYDGPADRSMP